MTLRTLCAIGVALTSACVGQSVTGAPASRSAPPTCAVLGNPEGPLAYLEFQVDQPAKLRTRGTNATIAHGRALVQFVVDTIGRPDLATWKVLDATGPDVVNAAREIVAASVFTPALKGGCRVNQLIHHPYVFR